jgi:hypothetical protein
LHTQEKHGMIFKTRLLGHGVVFVGGSKGLELFVSGSEKGLGASPEFFLFDLPARSFNIITNHKIPTCVQTLGCVVVNYCTV